MSNMKLYNYIKNAATKTRKIYNFILILAVN